MVNRPTGPRIRRLNTILSVWVILTVSGASVLAQTETPDSPKIEIVDAHHDFGSFMVTDPIQHTFVVRNAGGDTLVIARVESGSGPARASFDREIPPGGTGHIEVSLEARMVHGRFSRVWTVFSNDPLQPELRIAIRGEIVEYFDFSPMGRVYLEGELHESVEKTVSVTTHDGDPHFEILSLSSDIDDLITYDFAAGKADGEWVIRVRKKNAQVVQQVFGSITVTTNHPNQPVRHLQVQVVNEGPVEVSPQSVNFGVFDPSFRSYEDYPLEYLILVLREAGGLEITGWEVDNDRFTAAVEEVVAGSRYEVRLRFVPPVEYDPGRSADVGHLSIFTNLPEQPEITVRMGLRYALAERD
jgi:hypothetical protein